MKLAVNWYHPKTARQGQRVVEATTGDEAAAIVQRLEPGVFIREIVPAKDARPLPLRLPGDMAARYDGDPEIARQYAPEIGAGNLEGQEAAIDADLADPQSAEAVTPAPSLPVKRGRGRPKGSTNKPKSD